MRDPHERLTCSKYKQVIHYEFTRLPVYQIYLFPRIKNDIAFAKDAVGKYLLEFLKTSSALFKLLKMEYKEPNMRRCWMRKIQ